LTAYGISSGGRLTGGRLTVYRYKHAESCGLKFKLPKPEVQRWRSLYITSM